MERAGVGMCRAANKYSILTFHGRHRVADRMLYMSDTTLMKRMGSIQVIINWENQKKS